MKDYVPTVTDDMVLDDKKHKLKLIMRKKKQAKENAKL